MSTVVGIDLGGTKVAAAMLRTLPGGSTSAATSAPKAPVGVLSEPVQHPTELSSTDGLIEQLVAIVGEARGEAQIDAVGIGVPSVVDFATGTAVSSANIPLSHVPLRQLLSERLGTPIFVDNDATVAALAEAHDEQLNLVCENLVMLTIGTGVGGGIVIGGRIFRGASGGAGEFGHTLTGLAVDGGLGDVPAAEGRLPYPGSLEAAAAGLALDRLAQVLVRQHPDSAVARKAASGERVRGADVVAASIDGDAPATAAVRRWAHSIGIGIANAVNTFDPGEVVIGGRIFRGASGGAGEFGHTLTGLALDDGLGDVPAADGRLPYPGSLEAAAAGLALDRLVQVLVRQHPDSAVARKAAAGERVRGADVVAASIDGDAPATAAVRRWAHSIGIGIANAVNTFDPGEVVIGGGAVAAGDQLLEPAKEIAEGYIVPGLRGHTTVRFARFGARAGIVGATLLAVYELQDSANR